MSSLAKISVNKLSINVFYDNKCRSSLCWQYFGSMVVTEDSKRRIVNPEKIYCVACLAEVKTESDDIKFGSVKVKSYSRKVSTGNLTRHLRTIHQIRNEKTKTKVKGIDVKPQFKPGRPSGSKSRATNDHHQGMVARDLVIWFCKSLIPFDSIAGDGTVDFLKKYDIMKENGDLPSLNIMARTALTSVFQSMVDNVKAKINIEVSRHCAVSLDSWTDQHRKLNSITFTLHYVTSNFELKSLTLSTQILSGKNTEEQITGFINDIKNNFALDGKNIHVVASANTNVRRAASIQNMEYHLCLGHGLHNLVTTDGINSVPEIKELVNKCKNIVMAIRYYLPEMYKDSLEEQQELCMSLERLVEIIENDENEPIPQNNLVTAAEGTGWFEVILPSFPVENTKSTATPTRWHCILEMTEIISLVYKCESIKNVLKKTGKAELLLTQSECTALEDLVKFLKKFHESVAILFSQKTCTINVALVFRCEIADLLRSNSEDEPLTIFNLKRNMYKSIDKRFPITKLVVASALLDKRLMALTEIDTYLESKNMIRATFLASYVKEIIKVGDLPEDMEPFCANSTASSFLNKLSKKHSSGSQGIVNDPVEQECWRYFASAVGSSDMNNENLLSFWNDKKKEFPWLSTFAKALLCIPATSIPCERIFTPAGQIFALKRSRLSPYRLNKITFIYDNFKECQIKVEK